MEHILEGRGCEAGDHSQPSSLSLLEDQSNDHNVGRRIFHRPSRNERPTNHGLAASMIELHFLVHIYML